MLYSLLQQTRRKLDDANKRLEALYDKLREQTVSMSFSRKLDFKQFLRDPGETLHIENKQVVFNSLLKFSFLLGRREKELTINNSY